MFSRRHVGETGIRRTGGVEGAQVISKLRRIPENDPMYGQKVEKEGMKGQEGVHKKK